MSSVLFFHSLSSEAIASRLAALWGSEAVIPLCDVFGWRAGTLGLADPEEFLKAQAGRRFAVMASTPQEARLAEKYAPFVYLPGELCRQGDVIEAVEEATLVLERGAFLPPPDMVRALAKARAKEVWAVDAGSSFGYSDRVLDPRGLTLLGPACARLGVHVPHLTRPAEPEWKWRSEWCSSPEFLEPLVRVAATLGATFFVVDDATREKVEEVLR